jgi:hypothetical protein
MRFDSRFTKTVLAKTVLTKLVRQALVPAACLTVGLLAVPSTHAQTVGDVFVIDMENHNFTQPASVTGIEQIQGNPAAPYMNSLITPGNANAAQTSYATAYHNAGAGIHPSEPNYIWQEGGSNYGVTSDAAPYKDTSDPNGNVFNAPNLSGLLQSSGQSWKSYQEDTDLTTTSGQLTSVVAPQSQWTVPLNNFSGTSSSYINAYNGSNQYNFATKHDGTLFYTDTNGGNDTTPANPEASHYAPLQQLTNDLSSNAVGQYNLITPNQYNDAHTALSGGFTYNGTHYTGDSANIAQGDNFLSQLIPQIQASQAYKNNGAILIWWDETEGGDSSAYTLAETLISPLAKGNAYASTLNYTHSSDVKTLQEIFGVPAPGGGFLGDANNPATHDLSDLFKPGSLPAAVPEASTTVSFGLLLALGMGGMIVAARKKKRA